MGLEFWTLKYLGSENCLTGDGRTLQMAQSLQIRECQRRCETPLLPASNQITDCSVTDASARVVVCVAKRICHTL